MHASDSLFMHSDSSPNVTIVIATYRRSEQLIDTIRYVLADEYKVFELIVVDQTDVHPSNVQAELEQFAESAPNFRYIRLSTPNLPLARNVGLRHARGDIIVYVDDDVIPVKGFIQHHLRRYSEPTVGAVAGRVTRSDAKMVDGTEDVGLVSSDGSFLANFDSNQTRDVDWGAGCNMSFRRSLLTALNGFDERFTNTAYREDGDMFARLKRLGLRVVFEPNAHLLHLSAPDGGCRRDKELERLFSFFRNDTLYFLKNCSFVHSFKFASRMVRWIYATYKVRNLSLINLCILSTAPFSGGFAYLLLRPDRLSSNLNSHTRS